MASNYKLQKERRSLKQLETELDNCFGEAFFHRYMEYCRKYVAIEVGVLKVREMAPTELEYEILYETQRVARTRQLLEDVLDFAQLLSEFHPEQRDSIARCVAEHMPFPSDEEILEKIYLDYHPDTVPSLQR